MIRLRQSTASQEVPLGIFVDSTDGDTEEAALTIANTDIKLWKSGAISLANKNSGGATYISNGVYYATLDATDTDTIGPMVIFVHVSGALAVRLECEVLDEAVYDVVFGTTAPSTLAATAIVSGGAITTSSGAVSTVTTVTNDVGITQAAADKAWSTTTRALTDKAGYSLSSAGVQAIWDTLTSALSTVGSIGKHLVDFITGDTFGRLGAPAGASVSADIAAVKAETASIQADTNDIQTRLPAALVTGRMDVSVGEYQTGLAPLQPTTAGRTLDVTLTGAAGVDWANVESPTTAVDLSGTTISTSQAVASVTGAVGSVTGNVGGSVASVTAAVGITSNAKKGQALSAFTFLMTDNTNHAPATGLTVSVTRSIDGGTFAAGTLSAVTEISNGLYKVDFGSGDLNGNVIVLKATATGADDTIERIVTAP